MSSQLKILLTLLALGVVAATTLFLLVEEPALTLTPEVTPDAAPLVEPTTPTADAVVTIGTSVEGRAIEAHTFGSGEKKLLFVGGIHGGYEWNSVVLAYDMIDHFKTNPGLIPPDVTVAIIPNLNPDGVFKVTGIEGKFTALDVVGTAEELAAARFNANDVDLNRNFACKWAPESTWRGQSVSAGTAAFSEPEAAALRDYVTSLGPAAVVFWHSQADTVYASECENGVLPETLTLMERYAAAAGYQTQASFDAYPITGDAEGWLASIGIPAITVELTTRQSIDWTKNLNGVMALFDHFSSTMAR